MVLGINCVEVKVTTKYYGNEISWTLGHCSNHDFYGDNQEYSSRCCLSHGNHNLECKDAWNDGWNGGYITVDGVKFCENFNTGSVTIDIMILGRK